MITLYKRRKDGGTSEWSIKSDGDTIKIRSIVSEGAIPQYYKEVVPVGKAGRSLAEQVQLRIDARVRGKLDAGFVKSKEELSDAPTNQLGLFLPMLATPHKNIRNFSLDNSYIQVKLDGHRCLINSDTGDITAYSRRGKIIDTLDHITAGLDLPDGITLDGEIYLHGQPLQTIASWAKRYQPATLDLEYHIYDIIIHDEPNMKFEDRLGILQGLEKHFTEKMFILPTMKYDNTPLIDIFSVARGNGYEGLIVRPASGTYGIGKRTRDLIKVKSRHDAEFEVVDIIKAERSDAGVLILKLPNGGTFKTLAPGTVYEKEKALAEKDQYIGRRVTCEYADMTKDGVPFHCVATRWREDL